MSRNPAARSRNTRKPTPEATVAPSPDAFDGPVDHSVTSFARASSTDDTTLSRQFRRRHSHNGAASPPLHAEPAPVAHNDRHELDPAPVVCASGWSPLGERPRPKYMLGWKKLGLLKTVIVADAPRWSGGRAATQSATRRHSVRTTTGRHLSPALSREAGDSRPHRAYVDAIQPQAKRGDQRARGAIVVFPRTIDQEERASIGSRALSPVASRRQRAALFAGSISLFGRARPA
jgi:hypothetical protein